MLNFPPKAQKKGKSLEKKMMKLIVLSALIFFVELSYYLPTANCAVYYNVVELGAKPDGKTESSKAFHWAWSAACASTGPVTIYVPKGRYYLRSMAFNGPCKSNTIKFRIDGTLVAPSSYHMNGNLMNWIIIRHVTGLSIYGGTLDGHGKALWDCKLSGKSCPIGAASLEFSRSKDIYVNGLTSVNSQVFHTVINGCNNVTIRGANFWAAGNSPNTDGIHVGESTDVRILNSRIRTGDDCISISPGSKNLWIKNIVCGPGHGISIGSLGKVAKEEGVENILVSRVELTKTTNGMRIKSWARPSTGFVRNLVFEHAMMKEVENPIIVDQHYCPQHKGCPHQDSGVKISEITYKDVHGTSATKVGVKFDCSPKHGCTQIKFENVKLVHHKQIAAASCINVKETTSGCL